MNKTIQKIINLQFELDDQCMPFNIDIKKIFNGYMVSRFYVKHFKDIHTVVGQLISEREETPYGAVFNREPMDNLLKKLNK